MYHLVSFLWFSFSQIHQLHEQLLLELNQTKLSKAKYEKDLKRVADERNSFRQEYTQIMSERGVVHQEINELQEKLSATLKQVELTPFFNGLLVGPVVAFYRSPR